MSRQFPEVLLDLKKWDQLSCEECVKVALHVERLLPPSFHFTGIETYTSAADQHHVAYFEWAIPPGPSPTYHDVQQIDAQYRQHDLTSNFKAHDGWLDLPQHVHKNLWGQHREYVHECQKPPSSNKQYRTKFALIPGNTITLGYDREHPVLPSDALIHDAEAAGLIPTVPYDVREEDFSQNWEFYGVEEEDFAQDEGFYDVGEEDFSQYEGFYDMAEEDSAQASEKWNDGTIPDEKNDPIIQTEDPDNWKKPSPNYAAMAVYLDKHLLPHRTVTLRPFLLEQTYTHVDAFLGGGFPASHKLVTELLQKQGFRLPSSDEWEYVCMAGRKKLFFWEENDKQLEYYPKFPQNTFGLDIAKYCYDWELCMEPGLLRGGDGGVSQCGWGGYLMHYLTYVSAYYATSDSASTYGACFRRAYSL